MHPDLRTGMTKPIGVFFFATYAIELQKRRKLGFEELNYECAELKFWGAISTKNSVDVACIYVN